MKLEPSPEETADLVRSRFGVTPDSPVPDLLKATEKNGTPVFILDLPDEIEGAHQVKRDTSFIVINQRKHLNRKRFTLAHELGHHYLGHGARVDTAETISSTKEQLEREANAFAAALLMPRAAVLAWIGREGEVGDLPSLVDISLDFGVSAQTALYRLDKLGHVSRAKKSHLDGAVARGEHHPLIHRQRGRWMSDSLAEEDRNGGHIPFEMQARVVELVDRDMIDEEKAAQLLHVNTEAAKSILSPGDDGDATDPT